VHTDEVARAAAVLGGAAAWPSEGGEPVFAEPWEGRAFAMALDVVERSGLPWEEFRRRLVAAIADDPQRPYYESWVVALERLVLDTAAVTAEDLERARSHAAAYRYDEPGVGDIEVFPVQPDEDTLRAMLAAMFQGPWWAQIRYGPLIQGAAYELRLRRPAELSMLDGYVTIDDGGGHLHVCIGPHRGSPGHPVGPELARHRRCRHAELYRTWLGGAPTSWGFRMFNGDDDQQLNVLLPNPFLDDDDQPLPAPDWTRLTCWDELRRRFLALGPDPADRLGSAFRHA
jgi:nitrile hydratase accessory protein